jgi:hypothetical protein
LHTPARARAPRPARPPERRLPALVFSLKQCPGTRPLVGASWAAARALCCEPAVVLGSRAARFERLRSFQLHTYCNTPAIPSPRNRFALSDAVTRARAGRDDGGGRLRWAGGC